MDGYLGDYTHTREGASLIYQCNEGYRPTAEMTSTCTSTAMWIPAPEELVCTFITGTTTVPLSSSYNHYFTSITVVFVDLNLISRNVSRSDIDCIGDTVSYSCTVLSNSESLHLFWLITFPGLMSINFTYNDSSILNVTHTLPFDLRTTLSKYRRDEVIESILIISVVRNMTMNGTLLECQFEDINNKTELEYNTSGNYIHSCTDDK